MKLWGRQRQHETEVDLSSLRDELAQARRRRRVAEAYRDRAEKILERNHFADAIEVSMRRKYGEA